MDRPSFYSGTAVVGKGGGKKEETTTATTAPPRFSSLLSSSPSPSGRAGCRLPAAAGAPIDALQLKQPNGQHGACRHTAKALCQQVTLTFRGWPDAGNDKQTAKCAE